MQILPLMDEYMSGAVSGRFLCEKENEESKMRRIYRYAKKLSSSFGKKGLPTAKDVKGLFKTEFKR